MAKMTREAAIELLRNKKVYVNGKSAEIQKKLFELGFKWSGNGNSYVAQELDRPFLFISSNMMISRSSSMEIFINNEFTEISADEITSIEVVPECPFKPFDKVLARDDNEDNWKIDFFSHYREDLEYPYVCLRSTYEQCIPAEGNEHLVDTNNSPEE